MGMLVSLSAQTEKGSWLVGGGTGIGFNHQKAKYKFDGFKSDGPKISNFGLGVTGSYFIADNWALGADVDFNTNTTKTKYEGYGTDKYTVSTFSIMPTIAYFFETPGGALPYLGAGVGFSSTSNKYDGDKETHDGFAWKGKGGIMFPLFPSLYVDLGLNYGQAYSKIDVDGGFEDKSNKIKVNQDTFGVNLGLIFSIKGGGN